jgi:hypothetical protein
MTEQDQDAIAGRTLCELRDIKEKIAKLREQARGLADSFDIVAHRVRSNLELLRFDRENTNTRFVQESTRSTYGYRDAQPPPLPKMESLDLKHLISIRDEIRAAILEKERLEKSLEKMGFSSPL